MFRGSRIRQRIYCPKPYSRISDSSCRPKVVFFRSARPVDAAESEEVSE